MNAFRSWPSKVVVAGVETDTNTYIGYAPIANAKLADKVWVVERISAAGANAFATPCLTGEFEPEPCATMTSPKDLAFTARA